MHYNFQDFEKFHQGKMDTSEAERFLKWLESPEGETTYHKWVGQEWDKISPITPTAETFSYRLISRKLFSILSNQRKTAAILLILISAISIIYFNKDSVPPVEYQTSIQPTQIVKSASRGKKTTVTLSDGSKVYLNSESSISYYSNFSSDRTINLTGEAFFEVVADSSRPFTVITKDLSTVALGTSFNINAYEEKKQIEVGLATGRIFVESTKSNSEKLFIRPGEGVGYGLETKKLRKQKINIEKIVQWKSGILQFEDMPLDEVLHTLERWYDVKIHWDKNTTLPEHKCTGKFKPNEYLTNVLLALSYSIDFNYTIKNKEVVLEFK